MKDDYVIFFGSPNEKLAANMKFKSKNVGEIYHHTFPSGEVYCQFQDNIRGKDVFLVQGITTPANDSLMRLLIMIDAAKRASARRITAVVPYFGYARQERKDKPRVPISAKLVANLIVAAGANRVLTTDIHAPQVQGFFDIPIDELAFQPTLTKELLKRFTNHEMVVVSPDIGAVKRAEKYAKAIGCGMAVISKLRLNETDVSVENFIGDVNGKVAVIVDDLTESAGTLIQAATECKKRGATQVICAVTHMCVTETGINRLNLAVKPTSTFVIDEFIHSNTVTVWWNTLYKPNFITEIDLSTLYLDAIERINDNRGLSDLF